jgi:Leucine-rich repeat (LRR) protein
LTGSISQFITMRNLEYFVLNQNQISGTLPASLGNLSRLLYMDLSNNQLSGPLLPWIGDLLRLEWLFLSGNNLNGTIPSSVGNLLNLTALDLSLNAALTGPIPDEIGRNLMRLTFLSLQLSSINGSLPSSICNLFSNSSAWWAPTNFPMLYWNSYYPETIVPYFPSSFLNTNACTRALIVCICCKC